MRKGIGPSARRGSRVRPATLLLATLALVLFFVRAVELPGAYLWGIRLGFLLFILGGLEGMVMIMNNAHTIGHADGGPGLPFVNWSTRAGDLRIAHLLGLHALQILPLAGYALSLRSKTLSQSRQVAYLLTFALAYTIAGAWLFWQAMSGRPLIALDW
jgi:hypothetical protein